MRHGDNDTIFLVIIVTKHKWKYLVAQWLTKASRYQPKKDNVIFCGTLTLCKLSALLLEQQMHNWYNIQLECKRDQLIHVAFGVNTILALNKHACYGYVEYDLIHCVHAYINTKVIGMSSSWSGTCTNSGYHTLFPPLLKLVYNYNYYTHDWLTKCLGNCDTFQEANEGSHHNAYT